jgi:hypothetical protein
MNEASVVTLVLWTVKGLLALCFLAAGAAERIGCAEVLGAAGLVLRLANGVLPWLPPLAAVGLAVAAAPPRAPAPASTLHRWRHSTGGRPGRGP